MVTSGAYPQRYSTTRGLTPNVVVMIFFRAARFFRGAARRTGVLWARQGVDMRRCGGMVARSSIAHCGRFGRDSGVPPGVWRAVSVRIGVDRWRVGRSVRPEENHHYGDATAKSRHSPGTPLSW